MYILIIILIVVLFPLFFLFFKERNRVIPPVKFLGIWGVVYSLLGTFFLEQSSFEHDGNSSLMTLDGSKYFHPLYLDNELFTLSLWMIGTGFYMNLIERMFEDFPEKTRMVLFYSIYFFSILLIFWVAAYKFFGNFW